MCCIFTWLAWCFDASHRVVVFIMACLISSSFCCLLLTASMAGVAMGYNYSLAEYIDLKETNISVYIKRGVYDDEIADDFDWRRSGKDSDVSVKDSLRSDDQPKVGGRRQNSIFESEGENKYEGALMRLTSSPNPEPMRRFQPEPPYTTPKPTPNVVDGLLAVADSLPGGSMERLKAIQAAARYHENKRIELATAKFPDDASARVKAIEQNAQIHDARRHDPASTTDKYAKYFNQLARHPGFPGSDQAARRFDEQQMRDLETSSNRFRDAVFGGQLAGWPTRPPPKSTSGSFFEYEMNEPTLPTDVKPLNVLPQPSAQAWVTSKSKHEESPQRSDYDDSNGLPSRRKRSQDEIGTEPKSIVDSNFFDTKFGAKLKNHAIPLDKKLVISIDADDDKIPDMPDYDITVNIGKQIVETKSNDDNKNKTINKLHDASIDNNGNVSFKEFIRKYIQHFSSIGNNERKEVHTNPGKRKRSMGYENKKLGNKQAKSFWWRISNSVQKQWNRVIMYEDQLISDIADLSAILKTQLKGKIIT